MTDENILQGAVERIEFVMENTKLLGIKIEDDIKIVLQALAEKDYEIVKLKKGGLK